VALKVLHVVGARPNFMKAAPVWRALERGGAASQRLVHTGQHYDAGMSDVFFAELGLPRPDVNLGVGSGSHAVQTAQVMIRIEEALRADRPEIVLVYGDVNSTVAAALVCSKLGIAVGHVEAGLRSFDRRMPEEINRVLTDQIADLLFTPSPDGDANLLREGVPAERIHLVGNVMIDTLVRLLPEAESRWAAWAERLGEGRFGLVTLHRPSNVDDTAMLGGLLEALEDVSADLPLVFPVHPRTRERMAACGRDGAARTNLRVIDPVGYLDFLALQRHADLVITDSGGIQEETTFLGVPCLTVRENTERPITVERGTNTLVGQDMGILRAECRRVVEGAGKRGGPIPLWDGAASERIAEILLRRGPAAGCCYGRDIR
jgi:UDP-N-acetylglucosamine 2-epimerase (non-hydrolysing)